MARPTISKGSYINILARTATGPDVYSPLCGITTKRLQAQANTSDVYTRDCADPEDVPTRELSVTGKLWSLSGSGVLNREQFELLRTLHAEKEMYRFEVGADASAAADGGYYGGGAVLTSMNITGEDGGIIQVELTIESSGPWVWTDLP